MDVRSNVHCTAWLKQGRALARRGMSGERRYAAVQENAQVRSTAESAFDCTLPGRNSRNSTENKKKNAKLIFFGFYLYKSTKNANLIFFFFLDFI
jgi:hypothetical protein